MSQPAIQNTGITRPLKVLVPLIKRELDDGAAAGMEHYRKAGEMLLEAKAQVQHGEFVPWVKRHFSVNIQQARIYMALAEDTERDGAPSFSSLGEFVRSTSNPNYNKPHTVRPQPWHEPVREQMARVDVEKLQQEHTNRHRERLLVRQLGVQLVDIGYKALATKLHPDKGGSKEAMARLNEVRAFLKRTLDNWR